MRANFPILEYLEHELAEFDDRYCFALSEQPDMGQDLARVHLPERLLEVRDDVYERAYNGNGSDRFTLAHELGHYLMHSEVRLARSSDRQIRFDFADAEEEADAFAAELLMPLPILKQLRRLSDVTAVFGVSQSDAHAHIRKLVKRGDLNLSQFGDQI